MTTAPVGAQPPADDYLHTSNAEVLGQVSSEAPMWPLVDAELAISWREEDLLVSLTGKVPKVRRGGRNYSLVPRACGEDQQCLAIAHRPGRFEKVRTVSFPIERALGAAFVQDGSVRFLGPDGEPLLVEPSPEAGKEEQAPSAEPG